MPLLVLPLFTQCATIGPATIHPMCHYWSCHYSPSVPLLVLPYSPTMPQLILLQDPCHDFSPYPCLTLPLSHPTPLTLPLSHPTPLSPYPSLTLPPLSPYPCLTLPLSHPTPLSPYPSLTLPPLSPYPCLTLPLSHPPLLSADSEAAGGEHRDPEEGVDPDNCPSAGHLRPGHLPAGGGPAQVQAAGQY